MSTDHWAPQQKPMFGSGCCRLEHLGDIVSPVAAVLACVVVRPSLLGWILVNFWDGQPLFSVRLGAAGRQCGAPSGEDVSRFGGHHFGLSISHTLVHARTIEQGQAEPAWCTA